MRWQTITLFGFYGFVLMLIFIIAAEVRRGIKLFQLHNLKISLARDINSGIGSKSKFVLWFYRRRSNEIRTWMRGE